MDTAEAFRTLRLDPSADGALVQNAYWALVRKAQERGSRDVDARAEIDRLNEAYQTLQPNAKRYIPPSPRQEASDTSGAEGTEFVDRAVDWLSEELTRTRLRWQDRNPEIALIGGAVFFLAIISLAAGASFWLVIASIAVVFAAVWAPWRRVGAGERADVADNS